MDKDTAISTNKLFHYTHTKRNLLSILKNGFQPRYSLECFEKANNNDFFEALSLLLEEEFCPTIETVKIGIPMCCFCDIPLKNIENHTKIYGDYAIGLKKEWGEENGVSPLLYLTKKSNTNFIFKDITKIIERIESDNDTKCYEIAIELNNAISDLYFYTKPYIGDYKRGCKIIKDYKYYDEREWRYIPSKFLLLKSYLTETEYYNYKSNPEGNAHLGYINFDLSDIKHIIVPQNEIEEIRELIKLMPKYKDIDLSIIDSIDAIQPSNKNIDL